MPKYFYIARDKSGNKQSGVEEGATQEEAITRLQARGLIIINILPDLKEAGGGGLPAGEIKIRFRPKHYRIKSDDLVVFCRQLATLLGAGVTILKSLDIIVHQVSSKRLATVIKDLEKNMEAGLSFHEAMAKHPTVFSELWVNLVESGEASGSLALVLGRLAGYLERDAEFKKKIVSALLYPAILSVAGLGALLFLTVKVIPTFAGLFSGFNIELPFLTKVLVVVSNLVRKYFLLAVIGVIIFVFALRKYILTKEGGRSWERFLLSVPTVGEFYRMLIIERFTSEMTTLIESGVPILYSLEITEHSVGSLVVGDIIRRIKDDVRDGKTLSQPLANCGFFDPMAVQMISIGEEIGELSNMFKRLNTFYQDAIDTFIARFATVFEPIMLVFMAFVIGTMVIGMFLPIFQISQIKG